MEYQIFGMGIEVSIQADPAVCELVYSIATLDDPKHLIGFSFGSTYLAIKHVDRIYLHRDNLDMVAIYVRFPLPTSFKVELDEILPVWDSF
jgi:hypothetical protein